MRKTFCILVGLFLSLLIIFPDAPLTETEETTTLVTSTFGFTLPAFETSNDYKFDLSYNIGFDRVLREGGNMTVGVYFSGWRASGKDTTDIKANFTSGKVSFWMYDFGKPNNLCINFSPGYTSIQNGSMTDDQLGLACGMGLLVRLFEDVSFRFDWGIGKYGDEDAFNASVGLSYRWN